MDSLLSPRRRLVLQGSARSCWQPAAASGAPAPIFEFGGPTMGSTYTRQNRGPAPWRSRRGGRAPCR